MSPSALLRQPPFCMPPGAEPASVAQAMVDAFGILAAAPAPLATAWAMVMQASGIATADPVHRAGMAAARDIDKSGDASCAHGYHNNHHFCEVLLCAHAIAQLAGLEDRERALVLLAALLHDFHHDGQPGRLPFWHELRSLHASLPYLRHAGVGEGEQAMLATLVLATDTVHGVPMARCCHDWHNGMMTPPPAPARPELAILATHPRVALMAVTLTEADVLPSVALTPAHAELTTARLEAEWGINLGAGSKADFIDRQVGALQVARFFEPNLQAIRRADAGRMQAHPGRSR
jgi:hypothetical protein